MTTATNADKPVTEYLRCVADCPVQGRTASFIYRVDLRPMLEEELRTSKAVRATSVAECRLAAVVSHVYVRTVCD